MIEKRMVLGVGNDILTDDGIGPKIVMELERKWPIHGVEYKTAALGGMELLEMVSGYDWVIFIDAIKTRDGVPGTVYEFALEDFRDTLHMNNVHDISFLTAMELGKQLGIPIPSFIHIYAIEIIEDLVFSNEFTPPVQARYPEILEEIRTGVLAKHKSRSLV